MGNLHHTILWISFRFWEPSSGMFHSWQLGFVVLTSWFPLCLEGSLIITIIRNQNRSGFWGKSELFYICVWFGYCDTSNSSHFSPLSVFPPTSSVLCTFHQIPPRQPVYFTMGRCMLVCKGADMPFANFEKVVIWVNQQLSHLTRHHVLIGLLLSFANFCHLLIF
jgi:hypothetical protein